jgi:hypothetical protein
MHGSLLESPLLDWVHRWAYRAQRIFTVTWSTCQRAVMRGRPRKRPLVVVDGRRYRAWRLRRAIVRATRIYTQALGVPTPPDLLILVQYVVYEGRQLNALLQAFDLSGGERRYVLLLAQTVNGRVVGDAELRAALRHQLSRVLEDLIGNPVLGIPLDLQPPWRSVGAAIPEPHRDTNEQSNGQGRHAAPFLRIIHKQDSAEHGGRS